MTVNDGDTILIGYDGSDAARHAIEEAGRLFPGRPALVVTVWASVAPAAAAGRVALPAAVIEEAVRNLDSEAEREASRTAEEGAELARRAGLAGSACAVRAESSVWATIVGLAEERDATAVVVGSRGRSGSRAAVLGSVSNAVVHQSRRPVVVVHPEPRR